ncbi:MAG: tRNA preQ1(34) S-adenosylmethionine ribosyltransferase-isomerase QueA, partial [Burkholderiales bacterium]|nr:tRNA preQ1(34) S-adenosylmethionine ribosyltransferase-isomerase QueA [Burkholderiales bacterium]
PELIAQSPAATRTGSRLLHVDGATLADLAFHDVVDLVAPGDVVVMNDTRVLRARVAGSKPSGGRVELLVERLLPGDEAWAQLKASHLPKVGTTVLLPGEASAEVLARDGGFFRLRLRGTGPVEHWLERHGELPLPPYIARPAGDADAQRYQTVYARVPGAVAAPTAGLHFDEALLARLEARGVRLARVTLHVGAGTFLPVRDADLSRHRMHSERFVVPQETVDTIAAARACGGRVLAVGTTSLRALEAASSAGVLVAGASETALFIRPGYRFRIVDRLLTNFHLPRSTLLMLVAAFAGLATIRHAYAHAIAARYRFFSYGDAMLLERAPSGSG